MSSILHRLGFRLREVLTAKPQKKIAQTEAICENRKKDTQAIAAGNCKRWRVEGKATGDLGEWSRGGLTRGDVPACDHDCGWDAQSIPCGVVDEETGQRGITCGSRAKTRDPILDPLAARWAALPGHAQPATARRQLKRDNGPESSGVRTQLLHRRGPFADRIGKPIQLLSDPPSQSKDTPSERGWGR
jgi:Rhodopirellula transposase DDE domain